MMTQTPADAASVERHAIDLAPDIVADQLVAEERIFQAAWKALGKRPANIGVIFQDSLKTAGLRAVHDPSDPLMQRDLLRAARSASAMADLFRPGIGPVLINIGLGPSMEVARLPKNDIFNVVDLRRALFAAIIARDRASLDALSRVDPRSLRTPGSIVDDYAFTFVEFLQALLTGSPAAGEKIVQAMAETDALALKTGNVDYALYIAVGEIDCFYALSVPDDKVLNEKLANALLNHRKFYDLVQVTPGRSQRNDPRGFIALGPLAAASFGYDRGRSISITSDYLPACLVDGRFAG